MDTREFDIVLWGATGFVGRRVAHHFAQRIAEQGTGLRVALGGRDRDALEGLRASLPRAAHDFPIVVGDAFDRASLDAMVKRTRSVCSVVGPYAKYGADLVAACVEHGTDYCDITGEVHWMRRMIDAHQDEARRTGARVIHACGFDSVPSELGVWVLQHEAMTRTGKPSTHIKMRVVSMRGGLNGGTAASLLNRSDVGPEDAKVMREPYSLNPPGERQGPDRAGDLGAKYDDDLSAWTMPFFMEPINTKVVRRTNALLGYRYGKDFRYDEAMLMGSGTEGRIKASIGALASGMFMRAVGFGPTRSLLTKALPKPGEGPDAEMRQNGGYELLFVAELADGGELRLKVVGEGDPNTESTSKLTAECAMCLAQDDIDVGGGFWTPMSAFGDALENRIRDHGVLQMQLVDSEGRRIAEDSPSPAAHRSRA